MKHDRKSWNKIANQIYEWMKVFFRTWYPSSDANVKRDGLPGVCYLWDNLFVMLSYHLCRLHLHKSAPSDIFAARRTKRPCSITILRLKIHSGKVGSLARRLPSEGDTAQLKETPHSCRVISVLFMQWCLFWFKIRRAPLLCPLPRTMSAELKLFVF